MYKFQICNIYDIIKVWDKTKSSYKKKQKKEKNFNMKKSYVLLAAICLIMSMVISIQTPMNISDSFVLNGNALSEDIGFEEGVGLKYAENQEVLQETSEELQEKVTMELSKQNGSLKGASRSFNIKTIELKENKVTNIGVEEEYVEKVPQKETNKQNNTVPDRQQVAKDNIVNNFNVDAENIQYLGNFKLTAYCPCYECSEGYGRSTASGKKAQANHTIAVDPKVIPYGTTVIVERNGVYYEYVAEDCGGAIKNKRIDVFFDSHQTACNFGIKYGNVYVITK